MKNFLLVILISLCFPAFGQLKSFNYFSTSNSITINWVIAANASCSYMDLQYSTDSFFSNYSVIYQNFVNPSSYDLAYQYTHSSPNLTGNNFYRLNLGTCGYSQTLTAKVGGKYSYLLYPNPVTGNQASIVSFSNPNGYSLYFYVFDHNGQMVSKSGVFQGSIYYLYKDQLNAGFYFFVIASTNNDLISVGKFYAADY